MRQTIETTAIVRTHGMIRREDLVGADVLRLSYLTRSSLLSRSASTVLHRASANAAAGYSPAERFAASKMAGKRAGSPACFARPVAGQIAWPNVSPASARV